MNIRQLETFYWISRLGTFSAAAERLHTSQANVSARIRELEQDLEVVLFDRIGRQVHLTLKGRELLLHAEKIVADAAQLRHAAGKADIALGSLRIGAPESIAVQSLVDLLNRLKHHFPALDIEFDIDLNADLVRKLVRGHLDVAVIAGPVDDPEIEQQPIGSLNLVWAGTAELIGRRATIAPSDFANLPIISLGRDARISAQMRAWLAADGVVPAVHNYCNNLTTMLQVARAGVCVCLIPESLVKHDIKTSALVAPRPDPPLPPIPFFVATRTGTLDPATADLARIVADVTRLNALAGDAEDQTP